MPPTASSSTSGSSPTTGSTSSKRGKNTKTSSQTSPVVKGEIVTVYIELIDAEPKVTRTVEVSASDTLTRLHYIIQACMGWYAYHMWHFNTLKGEFHESDEHLEYLPDTSPQTNNRSTDDITLAQLLEEKDLGARSLKNGRGVMLDYVYDYGDHWLLRVTVSDRRAGTPQLPYPHYTGGKGAAPGEDSGGVYCFNKFREEALAKGPKSEDWKEQKKHHYPNGFSVNKIDVKTIKAGLERMIETENP